MIDFNGRCHIRNEWFPGVTTSGKTAIAYQCSFEKKYVKGDALR